MLGNPNFGIITLTRNLRYELLDKSFSISVLHLINFLILCTLNQVDFTGIQAAIYKKPPQPHCCGRVFQGNLLEPKKGKTVGSAADMTIEYLIDILTYIFV